MHVNKVSDISRLNVTTNIVLIHRPDTLRPVIV